ncbi:3'-5' exonuclease [Zunongwangia sp. SCSIO 43204]|uniref:3'-5' exonuclease n=1 Tax=Zunongwangia sp. SCSIO 43204 TaxID=2779359 RepID=UPI001CAA13D2|nr:3'-5' exonuclease [Zunongwangia sp. SCSIO 43204]UAB85333.1 3'-5' exonuclease [Zunongwangia sp. SCSIO 43204]
MQLQKLNLEHILFLDIETVPEYASFEELDEIKQELWAEKTKYIRKEEYSPSEFYPRAGIWAEFGKIVCISVGFLSLKDGIRDFRLKSFSGDEKSVLVNFSSLLNEHFSKAYHLLCAHNGKEFDFPFIARRMIVHHLKLPGKLNSIGKRPWEIPHLDTMELWRFGDYKHFTSLKLLTNVLGIPSPKNDIDGSQVYEVFYTEKNVSRIIEYCERDVVAIAQIVLRLKQETLLKDSEISSVSL